MKDKSRRTVVKGLLQDDPETHLMSFGIHSSSNVVILNSSLSRVFA